MLAHMDSINAIYSMDLRVASTLYIIVGHKFHKRVIQVFQMKYFLVLLLGLKEKKEKEQESKPHATSIT